MSINIWRDTGVPSRSLPRLCSVEPSAHSWLLKGTRNKQEKHRRPRSGDRRPEPGTRRGEAQRWGSAVEGTLANPPSMARTLANPPSMARRGAGELAEGSFPRQWRQRPLALRTHGGTAEGGPVLTCNCSAIAREIRNPKFPEDPASASD